MKTQLTKQRLIELGNSLMGIIQELESSLDTPDPNPKKRRNRKQEEVAQILNLLDRKK